MKHADADFAPTWERVRETEADFGTISRIVARSASPATASTRGAKAPESGEGS
jgi:hypothetical protein